MSTNSNIRLLIVEDHQVLRDGLIHLLSHYSDINIVGEAKNGQEALDILENQAVDIIITDLNMPVMDGLELTEKVIENYSSSKIIILTMIEEPQYIKKLMGSGAEGFLFKNSGINEILKAIETVYNGESFLSDEVVSKLTEYVIKRKKLNPSNSKFGLRVELSKREMEVLELIIKEYSNQEIAEKLYISVRTVDAHKRNLIEKTGSRNLAGLVMYAITHELFDPI